MRGGDLIVAWTICSLREGVVVGAALMLVVWIFVFEGREASTSKYFLSSPTFSSSYSAVSSTFSFSFSFLEFSEIFKFLSSFFELGEEEAY